MQWCLFLLSLANNMIALSDLFSFYFISKWENFKVIPSRVYVWQFSWNCIIELRRFWRNFQRDELDPICCEILSCWEQHAFRSSLRMNLWGILHVHDVVLFICYSNIFPIFKSACYEQNILIRIMRNDVCVWCLSSRMTFCEKVIWLLRVIFCVHSVSVRMYEKFN